MPNYCNQQPEHHQRISTYDKSANVFLRGGFECHIDVAFGAGV
jgi:hypothetical protein